MDTRNATPEDDFLPGHEFRDRKGRGFAEFADSTAAPSGLGQRWHVRRVESTGSTNDDLVQAAQVGAPDRLVLVADHQTAGRGRLDRRWDAPPEENLLVSFLFRDVPDPPHRLTRSVAMAAIDACGRIADGASCTIDVSLKWPNDIVIDSRKLAGILATASTARSEEGTGVVPEFVVVGLGLNVQWAPENAVSLSEFVAEIHRDDVLLHLLSALDAIIHVEAEDLHTRYRANLSTIGRIVRAELPSGDVIEGRALDVGLDGRLEVLDLCAMTHHIDVGDVVHLRLAED